MAKLTIDLLTGKVYLLTTEISGSTPTSGSTYIVVDTYANLPAASSQAGQIYVVKTGTGTYIPNRKDAGLYYSTGTVWNRLGDTPAYFSSANFQVYDSVSNTKGIKFVTSNISASTFRNITFQNSDGTVAYLTDLNAKLDASVYAQYTGNTQTFINGLASDILYVSGVTDTKLNTTDFNTYSGVTNILINNKVDTSDFNTYTGDTETELNTLYNYTGNGIITGFTITRNGGTGATTINISNGTGYIVDNTTNPNLPVVTKLVCTGRTGVTLTYLTTNLVTYLAVDKNKNLIQQTTHFTPEQRRDYVLIGAVIHTNKTNINAINNLPDVVLDSHNQLNDLIDGIGNFNVNGNVFGPDGANLQINKSQGEIFKRGVNFNTNPKNPHTIILPALLSPSNIRYRLSDGTEYSDTNVINPGLYESPLGSTAAVASNKFSVQRITVFSSNLVRIQYGQHIYDNIAAAVYGIDTNEFIVEQNIGENGLLRGFLIVRGSTTDLNNTADALFLAADKFGAMPIGSAGSVSAIAWGGIIGTLSDQLDLQLALDGKSNTGHTHSYNDLTNKLSGGTGISIDNNVINYTGTGGTVTLVRTQLKDISGNTNVNLITGTSINWTTEEYSAATFTYTGGSRIYVGENGMYGISYALNVYSQSGASKNVGTVIRKNGDTDITPTSSTSQLVNISNKSGTNIMPTYNIELLAGDYIELIAFRIGDSGVALTKPDGSWITIIKTQ